MTDGENPETGATDSGSVLETGGGTVLDDYAAFIGKGSDKYLRTFKKFGVQGEGHFRPTWHWPAFFAAPAWLAYRKMYGRAVTAFLVPGLLCLSSAIFPIIFIHLPLLVFVVLSWPIRANHIYFRHVKNALAEIRLLHPSREEQEAAIAARGGVSPKWLTFMVGIVGGFPTLVFFPLIIGLNVAFITNGHDAERRMHMLQVYETMGSAMEGLRLECAHGRYRDCEDDGCTEMVGFAITSKIRKLTIKDGVITVVLQNIRRDLNGKTLTLSPDATGQSWTWGGTVPKKYLPTPARYQELINAAQKGDLAEVKALIASGVDVNTKTRSGNTALMWASFEGHAEVGKILIAAKADVNARNEKGETALVLASRAGRTGMAKLLKQAGARE